MKPTSQQHTGQPWEQQSGQRMGRRRGPHFTQRGVALIAVVVAIVLTGAIVTEFSTNTNVDLFAARNMEADMKAHFLARSGMNLGRLIIRVQTDVIDEYLNKKDGPLSKLLDGPMDIQLGDYVGLFIGAFGGSKEEVQSVADLIGGINADNLKGMGVPAGTFDVVITSDDGKINLNCAAADRTGNAAKLLVPKLQSLLYFDAYNPVFENADAEGWRRDRNTQIEAIIDYVDPDSTKYDVDNPNVRSGAPEDYGYEGLKDKYQAKNNKLDTVGEIKLIRGVDDKFWTLFGKNFTVYGGCKENLGAITDPIHLASIIALAAKEQNTPPQELYQRAIAIAQLIVQARNVGVAFADVKTFMDFVKDPYGALGIDPEASGGPPIEGIELDKKSIEEAVTAGPRRTYRVEVTATYPISAAAFLSKRIVGVWDTTVVPQYRRNPEDTGSGAWVFWREE